MAHHRTEYLRPGNPPSSVFLLLFFFSSHRAVFRLLSFLIPSVIPRLLDMLHTVQHLCFTNKLKLKKEIIKLFKKKKRSSNWATTKTTAHVYSYRSSMATKTKEVIWRLSIVSWCSILHLAYIYTIYKNKNNPFGNLCDVLHYSSNYTFGLRYTHIDISYKTLLFKIIRVEWEEAARLRFKLDGDTGTWFQSWLDQR